MSQRKKVHIIGGGIAGYSAAIPFLKQFDVHIWEKQGAPFLFSSSKNSAIARSYEADQHLSYLLKCSLFLMLKENLKQEKLFDPVGLLINPMEYDYHENLFLKQYPDDPIAESLKSRESVVKLPDENYFLGLLLPGNGILDINSMHQYFFKKASEAQARFYQEIKGLRLKNNEVVEIIIVALDSKEYSIPIKNGDLVVNATGSWAQEITVKSGMKSPKFIPHKRHMFLLENNKNWFINSPVIWDEAEDFYIKYHDGDILVSHCDEIASLPNDYEVDFEQTEKLKEVLEHKFVFLKDCRIKKTWSCLRTFTLDNRPVIGFDPFVRNFFWCAGWGGKGMSMALGSTQLIQELIDSGYPEEGENIGQRPFSAFRFV